MLGNTKNVISKYDTQTLITQCTDTKIKHCVFSLIVCNKIECFVVSTLVYRDIYDDGNLGATQIDRRRESRARLQFTFLQN